MTKLLIKLYCMLCAHFTVFAADQDIVNNVTVVLNDIMGKVKLIATPIAIICGIFCGIKLLLASDPQSVRTSKSWLITIVVGLLVIYLSGPLVNTVVNILNTSS